MAYLTFYDRNKVVGFIHRVKPLLVFIAIIGMWFFSIFEFHPDYDKIFILFSGAVTNVCICFILLYFINKDDSLGYKFLNLPALTFIGRLSYSLYLWQQLFLSNSGFWFSGFPQNIVLTFMVALGSYELVEKPYLKLKEKFKP